MTPITAKVINIARVGEQYFVGVQVGCDSYPGTFDGLNFGKDKPQTGWYLYGWLDLAYHGDPGFRAGQMLVIPCCAVAVLRGHPYLERLAKVRLRADQSDLRREHRLSDHSGAGFLRV
jgi:hypothetical protein